MALLVNGAGTSAADPILAGLRVLWTAAASSMDVSTVDDVWLDQASGFPGTNSVKASLSPASTVLTAGTTGSYDDTLDQLTISDTTGLAAEDPIYLSHASITDGVYIIGSVVNGTTLTLRGNPLDGSGALSNVAYQVGWGYQQDGGTAPTVSSGAGTQNWFKARLSDSSPATSDSEDSFYLRDAPAGSAYIALDGVSYTGQTFPDTALTLEILSGWTNNGGIATVELINHSVQSVNNFTWTSGGGVEERTIATAESSGLTIASGDGLKYGALRFRSYTASTNTLDVDIDANLDTTGPTIVLNAFGV